MDALTHTHSHSLTSTPQFATLPNIDSFALSLRHAICTTPQLLLKRPIQLTMAQSAPAVSLRRSARTASKAIAVKAEPLTSPDMSASSKRKRSPSTPQRNGVKKVKPEPISPDGIKLPTSALSKSATKVEDLKARKLKSFSAFSQQSPYPDFSRPTAQECHAAHRILAAIHGERARPEEIVAPTSVAGCGNSPSVLDALVRTILSQNTSNKNSTRAKLSMDAEYGGSDQWEAIAKGGQPRLEKAIQSGGLAATKSRVIIGILEQVKEKYGEYSLDHLFQASNEDAMREMISFQGVGPKTASCVLLFCLQRPSFAVDTHVHRITGLLGWRPSHAGREETQAHLDAVVPDDEKYPLHVLFVTHGRECSECKAGGKSSGKCELRKVFKGGRFIAGHEDGIKSEGHVKKEE